MNNEKPFEDLAVGEVKRIITTNLPISNGLQTLINEFKERQANLQEILAFNINKQLEPLQKAMEAFLIFSERLPASLHNLAKHGWYICGESSMTESVYLDNLLQKNDVSKVDKHMLGFYESELQKLSKNLIHIYPERKKLILEAINAHKKKMYFASTMLFLSIADGLCNGYLFMIAKEKKKLKDALKDVPTLDVFVATITNISAIDTHTSEMSKYSSNLNRHAVIHGHDLTYGTKINSLKAFSLLAFVGDFIGGKLKKKP